MIWHREEYLELMTFEKIERQMFSELFGPLVGLEEEWLAPVSRGAYVAGKGKIMCVTAKS